MVFPAALVADPATTIIDVNIKTERKNWALFFTDTLDLNEQWALTLSGRYQHTNIKIQDKSGIDPKLNGNHSFSRFSPAAGLSYTITPSLTLFTAYNESFRTPTAAELTCADPDDPCNLPNSFVADPPLAPVIGKTLEIGLRGNISLAHKIQWSAALFRTQLKDDLLFTATGTNGAGYFINVDETQRQGLEFSLTSQGNKLDWYGHYSFIDATFESNELLASVVEPTGIQVQSGDSLPAIPRHNVKLGVNYAFTETFSLSTDMVYASGSYMRGDESNNLPKLPSYSVFNINARYQPTKQLQFWLKVANIFDKEYANSGIRNFNAFPANGGEIKEERFVSPGAPRSAWMGLKVQF
ncbi:MAG: TonB-dependent receptor [Gammaproteobacteria bacterium]|nr:TonB-dependent receptor [Gammaproteobacteria bacterium]